jgi:hypothetical protein
MLSYTKEIIHRIEFLNYHFHKSHRLFRPFMCSQYSCDQLVSLWIHNKNHLSLSESKLLSINIGPSSAWCDVDEM